MESSGKGYAGTIPFDKPVQSYRLELNEEADDSQKDGIIEPTVHMES